MINYVMERMQSPSQSQGETIPNCLICNQGEQDIRILLHNLVQSLSVLTPTQNNPPIPDNGGFLKLLKIMFNSNSKYKHFSRCPHLKIRNMFEGALGVDAVQLDLLSNLKMLQMAKFSYQIDIISHQIKSFNRHFTAIEKKEKRKERQRLKLNRVEQTPKSANTKNTSQKMAESKDNIDNKIKQEFVEPVFENSKEQVRPALQDKETWRVGPESGQAQLGMQMFQYPITYPFMPMHAGWYMDMSMNTQP